MLHYRSGWLPPFDDVIVGDIDNGEKGVWTEYGYTKPEFDAFPGAVKLQGMLNFRALQTLPRR